MNIPTAIRFKRISFVLLYLLVLTKGFAQETFRVTIISDAEVEGNHTFEEDIKAEITALLASRYALEFTEVYTKGEVNTIAKEITTIFTNRQADVLIGSGIISSKILGNQPFYPIPTIATIQLAGGQQAVTANQTSGISNFTFINPPFHIEAGLRVLSDICRCDKLAVLTNASLFSIGINEEALNIEVEPDLEWLPLDAQLSNTIADLPEDIGGVYILSPLGNYTPDQMASFFDQLNARGLPSFSLFESPMLERGAYAAFAASDNLKKIPRRIALNVEKIAEGEDPKAFPVHVETFSQQLVVNMETVNKVGVYPDWVLLDDALLVNINRPDAERVLSLKAAIAEGMQNNLGYQIEVRQTDITGKDVRLAQSNYLPQLDAETTGFFVDENTINGSFGTLGSFNWRAGASFSQLILSEPALANIAIQKLLFESQQQVQKQSELDVVLEVAQRYLSYLQVLSVAELQNNNIRAVNQNLTIAANKEKVGYSGASDVYRWQTELNLAKTDLNATNAQLKAAGYQLNETLNRAIDEAFLVESSENINSFIDEFDQRFLNLIQDQTTLDQLADFLVDEARRNLPELAQIALAISAQERLLKSNKRSFFLPTVAFGATYDYPVSTVNPGVAPPIPGLNIENNATWNAAFNLSIPLFAGGSRKFQKEKTEVGLYQLQDQQKDVNNLLELQVRANVELVNASYNNIRLTRSAAEAAQNNARIVQDLYQSGQVSVITLVDAQNSLLGAQINATNAAYQFMLDFFSLQRAIGNYIFLATQEQQSAFYQRFLNYKSN